MTINPAKLSNEQPRKECSQARPFIIEYFVIGCALFVVYFPVLHGKPLWDDDGHLTKPELRGTDGLKRIWFELGATQQYYPLVHSVFWIEHQLWGDAYVGYHVVNVLLHATSACLLAILLRRLKIPGALLAAAVFALHPVHVESVAWMSELKNTLSAVLYLGSALFYLKFDSDRRPMAYALAFGLFILALLSKTVTATLPAALLVIMWWRQGSLSLKRDVVPLLPWFVIGAAAGLFTAWVEKKYIGAEGEQYALSVVQRFVLSGKVVWFYLGKLIWPQNLIFVYPRWNLNALHLFDYLYFPMALWALLIAWILRSNWRGPLATMLLFGGTLFPVLGFFNVFPFVYSYVADHFQYLASMAIITFLAACASISVNHAGAKFRLPGYGLSFLTIALLGFLTWRQSHIYRDAETLYRATLARNPDCWLAHNNLSVLLRASGRVPEAMQHSKEAIDLNPKNPASHNNMSLLLSATGSVDEAIFHAQEAIRLNPNYPEAHNNLGAILASRGDLQGAKTQYATAVRLEKNYAQAHANLGRVYFLEGNLVAAADSVRTALQLDGKNPQAHYTLAQLLRGQGDDAGALEHYDMALQLQPKWPGPLRDLQSLSAAAVDPSIRSKAQALYSRHQR